MSKIYKHYLELKEKDKDTMYLFKSGMFHIFVGEDADKINNYVVLKKTDLTSQVKKCGFPNVSHDEYMRVFENHRLKIKEIDVKDIPDNDIPKKYKSIIFKYYRIKEILEKKPIEYLTPVESLNVLSKISELINDDK